MAKLRSTFEQHVFGRDSKQKNDWYCFPAVVSNASRLLGFAECTQDWITEEWGKQRALDANGCIPANQSGPDIIDVLSSSTDYASRIRTEPRSESSDPNQFDPDKGERAFQFIQDQLVLSRPVLVSLTNYVFQGGNAIVAVGFHMLLVLEIDAIATIHDPAVDCICRIPLKEQLSVVNGVVVGGLFNRLARSDYYCASFDNM